MEVSTQVTCWTREQLWGGVYLPEIEFESSVLATSAC